MNSARIRHAAFWLIVTGMAFFSLAASSPQCSRTPVSVTGPSLGAQGSGDACSQGCIDVFQAAKRAEQVRFKAAMAACNTDADCRAAESATHDEIVAELAADKDACLVNCLHDQGGGVGGQ